ncbi:hypothetical protein [Gellertiella hungarica]|uniref:Ferric iron reductase protein FhuF n=1 Tax=Gellertiella hungarica TaxID=1572859 RepID=A0A7W6JA18_9HYPH|nr:hypothetical protein [Gellertiella hungarica]MBB4066636.1 ferric iron reductase protein FhuF [Gellertiella hungarica]
MNAVTRPALQPIIPPARPGLAEIFSGEQAWCAEKLRPAHTLTAAVPLRTFLEGPLLGEALDCLSARHAGADRRAVASFWTLYYVSALSIPYVVARMAGRRLSAEIDHLTLLTD